MKQQVGGLEVKNDGAFWMEYSTFLQYFYNIAAAMYQPYKYSLKDINVVER